MSRDIKKEKSRLRKGEQNERGGKNMARARSQADTSQTQRSSESKIFRKKK